MVGRHYRTGFKLNMGGYGPGYYKFTKGSKQGPEVVFLKDSLVDALILIGGIALFAYAMHKAAEHKAKQESSGWY